jgi:hypothetical protein
MTAAAETEAGWSAGPCATAAKGINTSEIPIAAAYLIFLIILSSVS